MKNESAKTIRSQRNETNEETSKSVCNIHEATHTLNQFKFQDELENRSLLNIGRTVCH